MMALHHFLTDNSQTVFSGVNNTWKMLNELIKQDENFGNYELNEIKETLDKKHQDYQVSAKAFLERKAIEDKEYEKDLMEKFADSQQKTCAFWNRLRTFVWLLMEKKKQIEKNLLKLEEECEATSKERTRLMRLHLFMKDTENLEALKRIMGSEQQERESIVKTMQDILDIQAAQKRFYLEIEVLNRTLQRRIDLCEKQTASFIAERERLISSGLSEDSIQVKVVDSKIEVNKEFAKLSKEHESQNKEIQQVILKSQQELSEMKHSISESKSAKEVNSIKEKMKKKQEFLSKLIQYFEKSEKKSSVIHNKKVRVFKEIDKIKGSPNSDSELLKLKSKIKSGLKGYQESIENINKMTSLDDPTDLGSNKNLISPDSIKVYSQSTPPIKNSNGEFDALKKSCILSNKNFMSSLLGFDADFQKEVDLDPSARKEIENLRNEVEDLISAHSCLAHKMNSIKTEELTEADFKKYKYKSNFLFKKIKSKLNEMESTLSVHKTKQSLNTSSNKCDELYKQVKKYIEDPKKIKSMSGMEVKIGKEILNQIKSLKTSLERNIIDPKSIETTQDRIKETQLKLNDLNQKFLKEVSQKNEAKIAKERFLLQYPEKLKESQVKAVQNKRKDVKIEIKSDNKKYPNA